MEIPRIKNPADFKFLLSAFQLSRICLTALELDIFSLLAKAPATSAELAGQLGSHHKATDRLLNALCALHLLEKKDETFTNSAFAQKHLASSSPGFLAGSMHSVHLWQRWHKLTASVLSGKPATDDQINERSEDWLEAFIGAMHERGIKQAQTEAALLKFPLRARLLDIGGGSGVFSMEFIRTNPQMTATVFDLPNVVPITQKYIEKYGFKEKIDTAAGNYLTDPFPKNYDVILLSAIVHINSFEENRQLIQKAAQSLNPGGMLVIRDFIMEDDRTYPMRGAVFALNMLVSTQKGDTYTFSEMKNWLQKAGMKSIEKRKTPNDSDIVIAKKP